MKKTFFKITTVAALTIVAFFSFQQTAEAVSIRTTGGNVLATLNPSTPGPNENVTISLSSPGFLLDYSDIVWKLNGANANSKSKVFNFTTGGVGSVTHIEAQITVNDPEKKVPTIIKIVIMVPVADVDLLWEANTSVPFFYQGKALANSVSPIKVVALPNVRDEQGRIIPNESLIFNWQKDSRTITSASGVGKNTFVFAPNNSNSNSVLVEVSTLPTVNPPIQVKKAITIRSARPKLLFYTEHPTQGTIFNKLVPTKINLNEDEIALRAEPFFFSKTSQGDGGMSFDWRLNGTPFPTPSTISNIITLRRPPEKSGFSNITLTAKDATGAASNNFTIFYGQETPSF